MEEERVAMATERIEGGEMMLPGFRFHPTDEELVDFYLKTKILHRHRPFSSIDLIIKHLDIYSFDPWDLPKHAATFGEKEWYFYCPRDRKYRNSARPNRVTKGGFWKATGTDRPIYSSQGGSGNRCMIGLKKSLVFYRGKAAKGVKTDWMMHEFRLPSLASDCPAPSPKTRPLDKRFAAAESWAICKIFRKPKTTAQRALSCPYISPVLEEATPPSSCSFLNNKAQTQHQFTTSSYPETSSRSSSSSSSGNNQSGDLASVLMVSLPYPEKQQHGGGDPRCLGKAIDDLEKQWQSHYHTDSALRQELMMLGFGVDQNSSLHPSYHNNLLQWETIPSLGFHSASNPNPI